MSSLFDLVLGASGRCTSLTISVCKCQLFVSVNERSLQRFHPAHVISRRIVFRSSAGTRWRSFSCGVLSMFGSTSDRLAEMPVPAKSYATIPKSTETDEKHVVKIFLTQYIMEASSQKNQNSAAKTTQDFFEAGLVIFVKLLNKVGVFGQFHPSCHQNIRLSHTTGIACVVGTGDDARWRYRAEAKQSNRLRTLTSFRSAIRCCSE